MAREGFVEEGISGIYTNPKQAHSLAVRSLKEKCNCMKMDRENAINTKIKEKIRLEKLIKASKNYLKGTGNQVMLDEENVVGYEADLTRLDLEINQLGEQLKMLKSKKFDKQK